MSALHETHHCAERGADITIPYAIPAPTTERDADAAWEALRAELDREFVVSPILDRHRPRIEAALRAQGDSATTTNQSQSSPKIVGQGDSATPHIHPGEFHPDCALCVGAVRAFQGDSATSALLREKVEALTWTTISERTGWNGQYIDRAAVLALLADVPDADTETDR